MKSIWDVAPKLQLTHMQAELITSGQIDRDIHRGFKGFNFGHKNASSDARVQKKASARQACMAGRRKNFLNDNFASFTDSRIALTNHRILHWQSHCSDGSELPCTSLPLIISTMHVSQSFTCLLRNVSMTKLLWHCLDQTSAGGFDLTLLRRVRWAEESEGWTLNSLQLWGLNSNLTLLNSHLTLLCVIHSKEHRFFSNSLAMLGQRPRHAASESKVSAHAHKKVAARPSFCRDVLCRACHHCCCLLPSHSLFACSLSTCQHHRHAAGAQRWATSERPL